MGRFLSQPLATQFHDFDQIRYFLSSCRYVSDQKQFGKADYWMPPEQFEQTRKGDCDDFALWTWRQLLGMGLNARFVVGESGRYGTGHAWVTYTDESDHFLVEPLASGGGMRLPKLSIVRYKPEFSVGWNGEKLLYYVHEDRCWQPTISEVLPLFGEWLLHWSRTWARLLVRVPRAVMLVMLFVIRRVFRVNRSSQSG